jgi:hypothetical protein
MGDLGEEPSNEEVIPISQLSRTKRLQLTRDTSKHCGATEIALLWHTRLRTQLEIAGYPQFLRFITFTQWALLNHRDLLLLITDVMRSRGYRRRLHLRFLATLIYEFLDDLQVVLNRDLRPEVETLLDSPEEKAQFREICQRLNRTRDANSKALSEIRNNVAAHRDHDPQKQLAIIESLNDDSLLRLAYEVSNWLAVLEAWCTSALLELTKRTAPDLLAGFQK